MLIEIGIGFIFAFLFVTAYLVVAKLLRGNDDERTGWRKVFGAGSERALEAKPTKLFLTTGEMREHHAGQKRAGRQGK